MKNSILMVIALFVCSISANAQNFKFGLKGGLNFANVDVENAGDIEGRTGWHFGAVAQLSLMDTFAIQPEIIYSSQGAIESDDILDFNVDYLNVPVLAKLKFAKLLSVEAGPVFGIKVNEGDGWEALSNLDQYGDVSSFDIGAAFGAGVEVGPFFGQIRYNIGFIDIVEDLDSKNSAFQISVGYYLIN